MLKRLAHVNLSVDDVEAARRFYGQLLGLEEIARSEGQRRPGAWFRLGALELHLSHEPDPHNADSKRHVAFEVRDVDALRENLEEAGVAVEEGSEVRGMRRFFARDPAGNRLEFFVRVDMGPRCG
jgi:catechol 2,3-dioxygenase-like lactoylglutathione lyase family enzyme